MAELSELVPGSQWLDNDGDHTVILTNDGSAAVCVYRGSDGGWNEVEYDIEDEGSFFADWVPFKQPVKVPDFERFVGLDEDLDLGCGDIDTRLHGLIYDAFVFRIGVRDGEPFIERVKP